jgi:hypothetical protein
MFVRLKILFVARDDEAALPCFGILDVAERTLDRGNHLVGMNNQISIVLQDHTIPV